MPLPDVIEIVPPAAPLRAQVTVPGSKSITNRALILAALADGVTILRGALWSEDTQVMAECLHKLGFEISLDPDPAERCNRTIRVRGLGGRIPRAGTAESPLDLFVGNAGTAARFLAAFVCLGKGTYRLSGVPRMHERPQAALFEALRQLGYRIDSPNDRLPAIIHGTGRKPGLCWVSIEESSQFASALMLCAMTGGWEVELAGKNESESPALLPKTKSVEVLPQSRASGEAEHGYIGLTSKLIGVFPNKGGEFQIEPDASSGSYFWAAGCREVLECVEQPISDGGIHRYFVLSGPTVQVAHWPTTGWQIDAQFKPVFERITSGSAYFEPESDSLAPEHRGKWAEELQARLRRSREEKEVLKSKGQSLTAQHRTLLSGRCISRQTDLGDSIMTAIALAPLNMLPVGFTDLGRLRLQECERVVALRTELARCGAHVQEEGDALIIFPSQLHGAEIETYNDHRMAMCFAILGLKVPGIKIKNPACVKKTFPNFFQKLASAPPSGLGVTLVSVADGRKLTAEELFAG